jgi:hypothetical protein
MTDITNIDLSAALLDQKVAGEFSGKRYAFVAVCGPRYWDGWMLGVAVEDEPGYSPIDGKTFEKYAEADLWANSLNEHIGLDREAALKIICSTMRRSHSKRR